MKKANVIKVRPTKTISFNGVIRGGPNDGKVSIEIASSKDFRKDHHVLFLDEDHVVFHDGQDRDDAFYDFLRRALSMEGNNAHFDECNAKLAEFRDMIGDTPGLLITSFFACTILIFIEDLTKAELFEAMTGTQVGYGRM